MKLTEEELAAFVHAHGFAGIEEIAERFDVTTMTVRRTLGRLEADKVIRRVRSGAIAVNAVTTLGRHLYRNREEKKVIASYAVGLCAGVSAIFLDAGSTCYLFAELLSAQLDLTVMTQSLDIPSVLRRNPGVRVVSPGGEIDKRLNVVTGSHCEELLQTVSADLAILGTGAVDSGYGSHERELIQVPVKRLMNKNARRSYLLADSSKIGKISNFRSIPIRELGHVVTTDRAEPAALDALRSAGIEITVLPMP